MSTLAVVKALTYYNLTSIHRKHLNRRFFIMSSLVLFSVLYAMWLSSGRMSSVYSSDKTFSKLSFDITCSGIDVKTHRYHPHAALTKCKPYYPNTDEDSDYYYDSIGGVSPSSILFRLLDPVKHNDPVNTKNLARLLSSIMMNGLPLFGLDDYVKTSDFVNQNLNSNMKDEIMKSSFLRGQFGSFLQVRDLQIRVSPDNCWTRSFISHMKKTSRIIKDMDVRIYRSMYRATRAGHCCDKVWVLLEIVNKHNVCPQNVSSLSREELELVGPSVTLRFHPSSIPDSRNTIWSPRKQGSRVSRAQAGQLLYFTSGFLTMQFEIQNFFSSLGMGGPLLNSHAFSESSFVSERLDPLEPATLSKLVAAGILRANTTDDLYSSVYNISSQLRAPRPMLQVPVYDRAYPTRGYTMDVFWHKLAVMIATVLVVYFSLPPALVAGYFCRDATGGQFDSLFSLPGINIRSCTMAWVTSACVLALLPSIAAYIFFCLILDYTDPIVPAINFLLFGFALGPVAIIISTAVKRAEAAVIVVPTVVFLTMLPGMLYYDLAYDVQRSLPMEILLCLFPPSAIVMVARLLCSMEALHSPLGWNTLAVVSGAPIWVYTFILGIDFVIYFVIALIVSSKEYRVAPKLYVDPSKLRLSSAACTNASYGATDIKVHPKGLFHLNRIGFYAFDWLRSQNSALSTSTPVADNYQHKESSTFAQLPRRDSDSIGLMVSKLCKSYELFDGSPVEVLKDVDADLLVGSVTTLLGSNGAGKTTLMRILGGFDSNYTGTVMYARDRKGPSPRRMRKHRRLLGWCAQTDSLYDYLTVREHLEMFSYLLGVDRAAISKQRRMTTSESLGESSGEISLLLSQLDLVEHADKHAHALSGGMKRRLSLAMACLGNPKVLLLDEPTSGCDSYTRELVRKGILARKSGCAVLISTHHIDDVEVISDRVWFLNEHSLTFNGALSDLHSSSESKTDRYYGHSNEEKKSLGTRVDGSANHVEFSTCNPAVREMFVSRFPHCREIGGREVFNYSPEAAMNKEVGLHLWYIPLFTQDSVEEFRRFVVTLENHGLIDWSVVSPNAYSSLSRMYDITERKYSVASSCSFDEAETKGGSSEGSQSFSIHRAISESFLGQSFKRMGLLMNLRMIEIRAHFSQFLLSHILLPFLIVLVLVFFCSDVEYPLLELTSSTLGDVGEILVGTGTNVSSVNSGIGFSGSDLSNQAHSGVHLVDIEKSRKMYKGYGQLKEFLGDSLTWMGSVSSDDMFSTLYEEYFNHGTKNRWASFVVDDTVPQWLQSTVRITDDALKLPVTDVYDAFYALQSVVCNSSIGLNNVTEIDFDSHVRYAASLFDVHIPSSEINRTDRIAFCNELSSIEITIESERNSTRNDSFSDRTALIVTSYQSLHANLTMMTNVTTDHGAPIFLKEVAPFIYGTKYSRFNESARTCNLESAQKTYRLFSHPFDDANTSSPMYMQRGYLGALMIVLYILMTSTMILKFITSSKSTGVKTQIHLCGVSPALYWISNFIADSQMLVVSLLSIYAAIWIGGAPIESFFFDSEPLPGVMFLVALTAYAHASVAANYAFAVVSTDQISSQLISLVTTICGGLFLKLFLALHSEEPYVQISVLLTWISPSYALSSCLFEMFSRYVRQYGKSVGILAKGGSTSWSDMHAPLVAMVIQVFAYLTITILVDMYYYPAVCFCYRSLCSVSDGFHWCVDRTRNRVRLPSDISIQETIKHYIHMASRSQSTWAYSSIPPTVISADGKDIERNTDISSMKKACSFSSSSDAEYCGSRLSRTLSEQLDSESYTMGGGPSIAARSFKSGSRNDRPLLQCDNLSVSYRGASRPIIKELNVNVSIGERIALMGINGGGKSTLFKALSTSEVIPVQGRAMLCGMDSVLDNWLLGRAGAVGYVPQDGGLFEFMTVQEAVDLFSGLRSKSLRPDIAKKFEGDLYAILPKKYFTYTIKSLSGGNKRKLAVLLSNVNFPSMLMLDEPSSGVDPAAAERIVQYLCSLPDEQGLLFASHRLDECVRVCSRTLMLLGGRLQFDGAMAAFDSVSDLFYQIDVVVAPSLVPRYDSTAIHDFLLEFSEQIGKSELALERVVVYSDTLVRITLEKLVVPFSIAWLVLDNLSLRGIVTKYSFRKMDMEEIFSIMIAASKTN